MRKIFLVVPILLLAASCAPSVGNLPKNQPVACTMEAKLCPDGSYVSRTGPKCEFAPCPTSPPPDQSTSGIKGKITLGPTCPVQRIPPDPNCADKPYQATVSVKTTDGTKEIARFTSDEQGNFSVDLPPGVYLLVPESGKIYPRASQQEVTVTAHGFTEITIGFDSGIR
jgi:hypothetical protein